MCHFRVIAALVVATAAPGALAAPLDSASVVAGLATAAEHAAKAGDMAGAVTDQTVTVAGQEFYKNF
jgi:hypothetical protein